MNIAKELLSNNDGNYLQAHKDASALVRKYRIMGKNTLARSYEAAARQLHLQYNSGAQLYGGEAPAEPFNLSDDIRGSNITG